MDSSWVFSARPSEVRILYFIYFLVTLFTASVFFRQGGHMVRTSAKYYYFNYASLYVFLLLCLTLLIARWFHCHRLGIASQRAKRNDFAIGIISERARLVGRSTTSELNNNNHRFSDQKLHLRK